MIDDKITANLIDGSITADDSNSLVDDNITANEMRKTMKNRIFSFLSDTGSLPKVFPVCPFIANI